MADATTGSDRLRVVVGASTSAASRLALVWAAGEAAAHGGELHVVFAWQYPRELADGTYLPPLPGAELEGWAQGVVHDEVAALDLDPGLAVVAEARNGPPAAVLMDASEDADLLVVGTSAHGRITGLLLGSVSQYLTIHASCPVVVVHGPTPSRTERLEQAEPAAHVAATTALGVLEDIDEEECIGLLGAQSVGRLAVVHQGEPMVFPVNYVLDGRTVALRTDRGTKLDAATLGRVAFEIDAIHPVTHEGWSVVVRGVGRDVTDGVDEWSQHIRQSGVETWAEGDKRHWIAINATDISGRRIRHRTPDSH